MRLKIKFKLAKEQRKFGFPVTMKIHAFTFIYTI